MTRASKENNVLLLPVVGLAAWIIPGAGHLLLKEKKRAIIIFIAIVLTFCVGLYVGSIGVIDPVSTSPWYIYSAQIMISPMVIPLSHLTSAGTYTVYGWPNEIGLIYTSTAGLLNLFCVVNVIYLAHIRKTSATGD